MSIGNTICELIKSCCKMITWNKAPLNNFFVSPPSLMDFGWIWLSCEERRGKLEWFSINYRKTFLLNLTINCFLSFFHSKMISGKQPRKRGTKQTKLELKTSTLVLQTLEWRGILDGPDKRSDWTRAVVYNWSDQVKILLLKEFKAWITRQDFRILHFYTLTFLSLLSLKNMTVGPEVARLPFNGTRGGLILPSRTRTNAGEWFNFTHTHTKKGGG